MLTATYTLVALSVEQATLRMNLQAMQKYVRTTLMQQNSVTLDQMAYACGVLNQIYQACHWRKMDMFLIPAIRVATERADQLLEELNHLNQAALEAIRALQEQYGALADGRDDKASKIFDTIESFCAAMLLRLEKEEQELFSVARRVIDGKEWFSIANQLMIYDQQQEEARRAAAWSEAVAETAPAPDVKRPPAPAAEEEEVEVPALQILPTINVEAVSGRRRAEAATLTVK